MAFPSAPGQYEIYQDPNSKREWIWDGQKWGLLDKTFYQAQGAKGDMGLQGPTGATGATGLTGATGDQGPDGDDGTDGEQGPEGPRGEQGSTGIDGGAFATVVTEPPSSAPRGAIYLSMWNELFIAIG